MTRCWTDELSLYPRVQPLTFVIPPGLPQGCSPRHKLSLWNTSTFLYNIFKSPQTKLYTPQVRFSYCHHILKIFPVVSTDYYSWISYPIQGMKKIHSIVRRGLARTAHLILNFQLSIWHWQQNQQSFLFSWLYFLLGTKSFLHADLWFHTDCDSVTILGH